MSHSLARVGLVSLFLLGHAAAQPPLRPAQAAEQWMAARVFTNAPVLEDDEAAQNFQNAFLEVLTAHLGRPVGYKAALTNPTAQRMFGVNQPILGVLLEQMLQEDDAERPLSFAARPAAEADLLVRVSDPNINEAETDLELLAGLDVARPFIELADLLLPPGATTEVRVLTALNAGARAGVMGPPVTLTADQATLDRLASFTVQLVDQDEKVLGQGRGDALLGHPLHVVRWIRDTLRARGDRLREGHWLSLGTLSPIVPLHTSGRLTARYEGLATGETVSVTCRIVDALPGE